MYWNVGYNLRNNLNLGYNLTKNLGFVNLGNKFLRRKVLLGNRTFRVSEWILCPG